MSRAVRLCASPDTLAAYRASRPTIAEEVARLRAELTEAKAALAAAEAENIRLRTLAGENSAMGLSLCETRVFAALREATAPMRQSALARAASTPGHTLRPASIGPMIAKIRAKLAAAGGEWVIRTEIGRGYRLARVTP